MRDKDNLHIEGLEDRRMLALSADIVYLVDESFTSFNDGDATAGFVQVAPWLESSVPEKLSRNSAV